MDYFETKKIDDLVSTVILQKRKKLFHLMILFSSVQSLSRVQLFAYGNSPSREAVQTPAHTISKQGLGREARRGLHRLE